MRICITVGVTTLIQDGMCAAHSCIQLSVFDRFHAIFLSFWTGSTLTKGCWSMMRVTHQLPYEVRLRVARCEIAVEKFRSERWAGAHGAIMFRNKKLSSTAAPAVSNTDSMEIASAATMAIVGTKKIGRNAIICATW